MNKRIFLRFIILIFTVFGAYAQQFNAESDFQVRTIDNGKPSKLLSTLAQVGKCGFHHAYKTYLLLLLEMRRLLI